MDAIEIGHVIRGQMKVQGIPIVQSIHLISCQSAIDIFRRNISTGQILADYLNVNVTAYRYSVNPLVSRQPASGLNEAGKITFRPRLQYIENLQVNGFALSPADQQKRLQLIEQIPKDRLRHMWWHNFSARFGEAIAHARTPSRTARSTQEPAGLNSILLSIVDLVVGKISTSDFIGNNQLSATDIEDFEGMLEQTGAGLTDDECLLYCFDIFMSRQAWMNMVPTYD